MKFGSRKLESWGYYGEEIMTVFVLIQSAHDGRTDGHVAVAKTRASIASRG